MADTVETVLVRITGDSSNLVSETNKAKKSVDSVGASGDSAGKRMSLGMVAAGAAAVAGVAAVVQFSRQSIEAYNNATVGIAKFQQMAKDNSWSQASVAGLNQLNASLAANTVQTQGMSRAAESQLGTFALSADAINKLVPSIGDMVANQKGLNATTDDYQNISNLVGKVMTGNTGALSKYGVTVTDAQKKQLESNDQMTRASTLAQILQANFGGLNKAISETPAGQMKQLSNSIAAVKTNFGGMLEGAVTPDKFVDSLNNMIASATRIFQTMAPKLIQGVTIAITTIAQAAPGIITALVKGITGAIPQLVAALPSVIQAIVSAIPLIMTALTGAIPQIVSAVTSAIPAIVSALTNPAALTAVLTGAIILFMAMVRAMPQIIIALVNQMPIIVNNIVSALTNPTMIALMIRAAITLVGAVIGALPGIIGGLINVAVALVSRIPGAIGGVVGGIVDVFGNVWRTVGQGISNFVGGIGRFFSGIGGAIWNSIKGALRGALGAIPMIGGNIVSALHLASGGSVLGAGTATSDSVPAMLSRGEYVVRASSVAKLGTETLDRLNNTGSMLAPQTQTQDNRNQSITVNAPQNADPLALSQQIGRMTRWAVA